jgi:hypothetical protein
VALFVSTTTICLKFCIVVLKALSFSTLHDDNDSDDSYTYINANNTKLEADTVCGMSIATTCWAQKPLKADARSRKKSSITGSHYSTSSKQIRVKKITALAIRTGTDTLTIEEGVLSPLRTAKKLKTAHLVSGSKRFAPKGFSSNGAVA